MHNADNSDHFYKNLRSQFVNHLYLLIFANMNHLPRSRPTTSTNICKRLARAHAQHHMPTPYHSYLHHPLAFLAKGMCFLSPFRSKRGTEVLRWLFSADLFARFLYCSLIIRLNPFRNNHNVFAKMSMNNLQSILIIKQSTKLLKKYFC